MHPRYKEHDFGGYAVAEFDQLLLYFIIVEKTIFERTACLFWDIPRLLFQVVIIAKIFSFQQFINSLAAVAAEGYSAPTGRSPHRAGRAPTTAEVR